MQLVYLKKYFKLWATLTGVIFYMGMRNDEPRGKKKILHPLESHPCLYREAICNVFTPTCYDVLKTAL